MMIICMLKHFLIPLACISMLIYKVQSDSSSMDDEKMFQNSSEKSLDSSVYINLASSDDTPMTNLEESSILFTTDERGQGGNKNTHFSYSFAVGKLAVIPCRTSDPKIPIAIYKRNNRLSSREGLNYTETSWTEIDLNRGDKNPNWFFDPNRGIVINSVLWTDEGLYSCLPLTSNNARDNITIEVKLVGVELVSSNANHNPLFEGDEVSFTCKSSTITRPVWLFVNFTIKDNVPKQIGADYNSSSPSQIKIQPSTFESGLYHSSLVIKNITKGMVGTYICQKTFNDNKTYSDQIHVKVQDATRPVITNSSSIISYSDNSRPRSIFCDAEGSPIPQFQWNKNGLNFKNGSSNGSTSIRHDILSDFGVRTILNIESYEMDDSGNYTCVFTNRFGEARKSFYLSHRQVGAVADRSQNTSGSSFSFNDPSGIAAVSSLAAITVIILLVGLAGFLVYIFKFRVSSSGSAIEQLLNGNPDKINPDLPLDEQTELLPYDKKWEFPRHRLRLGVQLGSGCFGRVVRAEAIGLKESETVRTVAVKMVRSQANNAAIEALICELKIMIHLGSHLNVVNLLGASTKRLTKGDLLVIVEYCRFGSLQTFLIKQRKRFVNMVDDFGNLLLDVVDDEIEEITTPSNYFEPIAHETNRVPKIDREADVSVTIDDDGKQNDSATEMHTEIPSTIAALSRENTAKMQQPNQHQVNNVSGEIPSISTRDLICWSFQIARGMEYLVSKKVLHGDLAARNILLADDGVVKVADFGLSRQMYNYDGNYQKTGQALLPIKWMAIESLTDRMFSSQSDVWSFGVLLWELFSLGQIPYPGMEADERLIDRLRNGYRMEKPKYATNAIGDLMKNCWEDEPSDRPSFTQLVDTFGSLMESTVRSHYLALAEPYERINTEKQNHQLPDYFSLMSSVVYSEIPTIKSKSLYHQSTLPTTSNYVNPSPEKEPIERNYSQASTIKV